MATLDTCGVKLSIDFHGLDNLGDILYAYRLTYNGINVINPALLEKHCKDGVFLTTDCEFDDCGVLNFFKRLISGKIEDDYYENIEPPIVYIYAWYDKETRHWLDKRQAKRYFPNEIFDEIDTDDEQIKDTFCSILCHDVRLGFDFGEFQVRAHSCDVGFVRGCGFGSSCCSV